MKKWLAILLSIVMCFSCAAALAEDASSDVTELTLDAPEGVAYTYETFFNLTLTIPTGLEQTTVADTDKELGAFDMFGNASTGAFVQLRASTVEDTFDWSAYIESLSSTEGVVSPSVVSINGGVWITYTTTANQIVGVTTLDDTTVLTVIASPADDSAFADTIAQMMGSVAITSAE